MLKQGCVEKCPGCSHRSVSLEKSLEQKVMWLKKMLHPWQDNFDVIRSLPEEKCWDYREKVCLNTRYVNNSWQFGMLRRDELIDIPQCPVHTSKVRDTIFVLKTVLPSNEAFPMAFYYHTYSQVVLILKTRTLPDLSWMNEVVKLKLKKAGIEGMAIHLHPSAGKRLFDKFGWYQIYGRNFSFDKYELIYGNSSFHQLITSLYHQSLDIAETFFLAGNITAIVDLYCGRGVSLFRWCNNGMRAIGVETSAEAVICARINAPDALIFQGTCERRIPQLETWRIDQFEQFQQNRLALYTNPPRTGMEPRVTEWITRQLKPLKIAYLSCSAGTLKRDLDLLTSSGYTVKSIIPFDFFPKTYHVECMVLLEK